MRTRRKFHLLSQVVYGWNYAALQSAIGAAIHSTFYNGDFTVRGVTATPEAPVVVRAANRGKAVIGSGSALIVRNSAHVVVDGLQRIVPGMPVAPQVLQVDARGMPLPPPAPPAGSAPR